MVDSGSPRILRAGEAVPLQELGGSQNWADRTHRRGIYTSRSLLRGVFLIWWLC